MTVRRRTKFPNHPIEKADGHGKMKDELGGKGAGLAEMTNAGLPVPPGFTIQTEACREYMRTHRLGEVESSDGRSAQKLQALQGQKLGEGDNPLLVSVRSGAKFSMPGMMDTILNLGLNDKSVEGLAKRSNNPRFAYDSYRRLIQMFGSVVLDIEKAAFEKFSTARRSRKKPSSIPTSTPRRYRKSSPNTRRSSRSTPSASSRRTRTSNW
jgi:pyruvate,orthophosphate dikinase